MSDQGPRGTRLEADKVIIPFIHRYETTFGTTIHIDDLPYEYGEVLDDLPVMLDLTELSRNPQERRYYVAMITKMEDGTNDCRYYNVTHDMATDTFLFARDRR
jgi:hypothetical protein